jgi:predicted RNA methylase
MALNDTSSIMLARPALTVSRLRTKLSNMMWETYFGIETRGRREPRFDDAIYYAAIDYDIVFRLFKNLRLTSQDVFADIGCGKGRMICSAASFGVKKVIGIEIDPDLAAIAHKNAAAMRGKRSPIEILCCPAQEYSYTEANVLFLFNPFGRKTLETVVKKILSEHDGSADKKVVYAVPDHGHVLEKNGFDVIETYQHDNLGMDVTVYYLPAKKQG